MGSSTSSLVLIPNNKDISSVSLNGLDDNLLLYIFSYLPNDQLILLSKSMLNLTCKSFYFVLKNNSNFWKNLYLNTFYNTYHYINQDYFISNKELHNIIHPHQSLNNDEYTYDASLLFRKCCIDIYRNKSINNVNFKEDFQLITPLHSKYGILKSTEIINCFTICKIVNQPHIEILIAGTEQYYLQIYINNYGYKTLQKLHFNLNNNETNEFSFFKSIKGHYDEITSIKFLNSEYYENKLQFYNNYLTNCLYFVTSSKDKTMKLWKIEFTDYYLNNWNEINDYVEDNVDNIFQIKCLETFEGHSDWIKDICLLSKHFTKIITNSRDNTIKVWDLNKKKGPITLRNKSNKFTWSMCDHTDKGYLLTGSVIGELSVFDVTSGELIYCIDRAHRDIIYQITFIEKEKIKKFGKFFGMSNSSLIITSGGDKSIQIFNGDTFERLLTIDEAHNMPICSFSFNESDGLISSISVDQWVKLWKINIKEGSVKLHQTLVGPQRLEELQSSMSWRDLALVNNYRNCKVVYSKNLLVSDNDLIGNLCLWHNSEEQQVFNPTPTCIFTPKGHHIMKKQMGNQAICNISNFYLDQSRLICSVEIFPSEEVSVSSRDLLTPNGGRFVPVNKQKKGLLCLWKFN
ncbi:hypothetical protein ABK040_012971 [Willaertia magna]